MIVPYFNPLGLGTRHANLMRALAHLDRQTPHWIVAEAVFPGIPPALQPSRHARHVPTSAVLWHKERLINLIARDLPRTVRWVVWIDADVLLVDDAWPVAAAKALQRRATVQLSENSVYLSSPTARTGKPVAEPNYARQVAQTPCSRVGERGSHGACGGAWAAWREVFDRAGLFDMNIIGGGDYMAAHAFAGITVGPCIDKGPGIDTPHRRAFDRWSRQLTPLGDLTPGWLPGAQCVLPHGRHENRAYGVRARRLRALAFDPERDLVVEPAGLYAFAPQAAPLREYLLEYFHGRRDDEIPARRWSLARGLTARLKGTA